MESPHDDMKTNASVIGLSFDYDTDEEEKS